MNVADIVFVGKKAYYWSYMAPLLREYYRIFNRPANVIFIDDAVVEDPPYLRIATWRDASIFGHAITFDVWSLIKSRLHGLRAVHVHHSLVGKGSAFKGKHRAFLPFLLAKKLVLPHADRLNDLPPSLRKRAYSHGHVPFDWLSVSNSALPANIGRPLEAWTKQAAGRLKIALLCTHGTFGAISFLPGLLHLKADGACIGIKLHGYIKQDGALVGTDNVNLGDCPTTLAARDADIVVTDHSSAAIEAQMLGKQVFCYRSQALERLIHTHPDLTELQYLKNVRFFDDVHTLEANLTNEVKRRSSSVATTTLATSFPSASTSIVSHLRKV